MDQLTAKDRKRLKQYVLDLKGVQKLHPKKHDCIGANYRPRTPKEVVEMQLRGINDVIETKDDCNSAHQYSARSVSLQADSEERNEI